MSEPSGFPDESFSRRAGIRPVVFHSGRFRYAAVKNGCTTPGVWYNTFVCKGLGIDNNRDARAL